ncbi:MAG: P-II family nitrogen regulator [Lachnospiraceae bacterium]|nr:P-II family nitrogen regulator [Lachnospiraceae bacterium]
MELYYMIAVVDRNREKGLLSICRELDISMTLTMNGWGTATASHLLLHNLRPTEKTIFGAVVSAITRKKMIHGAERKLFIDIPGNGIMMFIPLKSVVSRRALDFFTFNQELEGDGPVMDFKHELIVVILNEGYCDMVMDSAREAGASGGTILHAKGTMGRETEKFYSVSMAEEKDMLYILAAAEKKTDIMQTIQRKCGSGTDAGAICFSLPVSDVIGLRHLDESAY